jgi:regulator of G-protein signaling
MDGFPLPKVDYARLWTLSIYNLINDEMGAKFYYEYLKKEFSDENLEFYLSYRKLEQETFTQEEYNQRAFPIYERFIQPGSRRELNINSKSRTALIDMFSAPKATIEYNCFQEVSEQIVSLMEKNSYRRFLQSDYMRNIFTTICDREHRNFSEMFPSHSVI